MSNLLIEDATLTGIANAIRGKEGSSNPIQVRDFAQRIANLPTAPQYSISGSMVYGSAFAKLLNQGLKVDISAVTDMTTAFANIQDVSSFDLSGLENTQNVTNWNRMFYYCYGLTDIDWGDFDASHVTTADQMFQNCSAITDIDLSDLDLDNLASMGYMFQNCTALTSVKFPQIANQNTFYMYSMFSGCSSLTSLDLSGFDTTNSNNMANMLRGCSALTTIKFGTNWKTTSSGTYTDQTTGTWTNAVTGVSYTGLQALLEAGRTQGAIAGTWVKS